MIDKQRIEKPAAGVQVRAGIRRHRGAIVTAAAAALVLVGSGALGLVEGLNTLLVALGFDPDRAQLITALVVGGTTAFLACLCGGARPAAITLGFAGMSGLFGATFVRETQNAMAATGATGAFDLTGWSETLLAFVVIGLLVVWACATCAAPARRALLDSAKAMATMVRQGHFDRRTWRGPVATFLVLGLLALTLPLAADMFNYGAEERMISGGPPRQGLVPNDQGLPLEQTLPAATPTATPSESPSPTVHASASAPPSATPTPSTSPTTLPPPWKASPPSGQGRVVYLAFGGPWVNAGSATVEVTVYLPPGYDGSGFKRYPAVYEAPFTFNLWNSGIDVKATLDALIDAGQIPPSLFVFINTGAGPYADPECANTYDGREQMDDFMGITVPAYIDRQYRTIAKPAARAIMGMSEGGYCAAILTLHHPGVFGSEISFSGYFTAGAPGAGTKPPFGGDPKLIYADSPSYIATGLEPSVKSSLYIVLVADSTQAFYGSQATAYAKVLDAAGIAYAFIDASEPHGWPQVRDCFAQALTLVGIRQAELGVFA
jgi:Enterochelin esterase and related enzymes